VDGLIVPQTPTIVGRITVGGGGGVRVVGSLVTSPPPHRIELVDVSDPTAPAIVITVDTRAVPGRGGRDGYAYVADNTAVQVIDVRLPSSAAIVGSLPTTAISAAVSGNRLYVLDSSLLKVIDVSSPTSPVFLGSSTNYNSQGPRCPGNLVYPRARRRRKAACTS